MPKALKTCGSHPRGAARLGGAVARSARLEGCYGRKDRYFACFALPIGAKNASKPISSMRGCAAAVLTPEGAAAIL